MKLQASNVDISSFDIKEAFYSTLAARSGGVILLYLYLCQGNTITNKSAKTKL